MTVLEWDRIEDRRYETGIDRGVLYLPNQAGVAWNGLVSVNDKFVGGESEPNYFDGVRFHNTVKSTHYQAILRAYSYPPEFEACIGILRLRPGVFITAQKRSTFGLCYRTNVNDDVYKIHLIYNATAKQESFQQTTISESLTPDQMSWVIDAVPEYSEIFKPTAHLTIDSSKVDDGHWIYLENLLYGTDSNAPVLPTYDEIVELLTSDITIVTDIVLDTV